jgi:hypothetical protein
MIAKLIDYQRRPQMDSTGFLSAEHSGSMGESATRFERLGISTHWSTESHILLC